MGRRFTIVELMIAVAIVSILAAIAIPAVVSMQLKAKRAEVVASGAHLADAMALYFSAEAEAGWPDPDGGGTCDVLANSAAPDDIPGKKKRPWAAGSDPAQACAYMLANTMGFKPDGQVYGSYFFSAGMGTMFAGGFSNVDGSGSQYVVGGMQDWSDTGGGIRLIGPLIARQGCAVVPTGTYLGVNAILGITSSVDCY